MGGVSLCDTYGDVSPTITATNSSSNQFVGGWDDQVVYINGTFTINTISFQVQNSVIQMAPGSKILVEAGNRLNIDNSFLFSCDEMWHGIAVETKGQLRMTGTVIEDAQYAINAFNAAAIILTKNTFDRNWVAVHFECKKREPDTIPLFYIISGSAFKGNELKLPFEGQVPLPGSKSFTGVWAKNVPYVVLKGSGIYLNSFYELNNGIISEKSNFSIRESWFGLMINEGELFGINTGIGIVALNHSYINQIGLGKDDNKATFISCAFAGIYCETSTCFTKESVHARMGEYGVYATLPQEHYVRVLDNSFENTNSNVLTISAVFAERSSVNDDQINDNYVYSNKEGGAAFFILNDMVGGTGSAEISRNIIEGKNMPIGGIELRPGLGSNFLVSDNQIITEKLWWGINVYNATGGQNIVVSNNYVEVADEAWRLAFLHHAQNTMFCNNVLKGPENDTGSEGLTLSLNCSGATIGMNDIEKAFFGLNYFGYGINTGIQEHLGNRWLNEFGGLATQHTAIDFSMSEFRVNDDSANCGDPNFYPNNLGIPSVSPTSGWFINDNNSCVNECAGAFDGMNLREVYQATVSGDGVAMGWQTAAQWDASMYLYKQIQEGVETGLSSGDLISFYNQLDQTSIADIYVLSLQLNEAYIGSTEEIAEMRMAFLEYEQDMVEHSEYVQNWLNQSDLNNLPPEDEIWINASSEFIDFIEDKEEEKKANLRSLLNNTTDLSSSLIEENWLFVKGVYLKRALGDEILAEEWDAIESIAVQCYDENGISVLMAQTLLPISRWKELYEVSQITCNVEEHTTPFVNDDVITANTDLEIYPHPGKNSILLKYKEIIQKQDVIVIKDIFGGQYVEQPAIEKIINIAKLSPGLYILQWLRGDQILVTEKFLKI